jgi:Glycosyl hydrolase family 79 C-terminal beta domain
MGLAVLVTVAVVTAVLVSAGSGDSVSPTRAPFVRPGPAITIGGAVGRPIPAGFLGLSIEFDAVRAYTGPDPHHINPVLVQLIRNITPGQAPVLRIGGDSTDTSWFPTLGVRPPPEVTYRLSRSWFATTGALARALGARMIMGVNLAANEPALAAAESRRYVATFGSALEALEIGNEPNNYKLIASYHTPSGVPMTTRGRGYDFRKFESEFRAIARVLRPRVLAGPALAAGPKPHGPWINSLPSFLTTERRVQILTVHRYPLQRCFGGPRSPQYPTIAHLLGSYSTVGLDNSVRGFLTFAHSHGRELRIDELNSVACRGQPGVSDSFAAGLWMLDALFGLARAGVDGVNVHTLPRSAYELFRFGRSAGRWRAFVPPVYYGLDMFARAAPPGSRLLSIGGAARAPQLSVWATRAPGGQVRALMINKSLSRRRTVTLRAPAGAGTVATVLRMQAPSVSARAGVTIGGASFGAQTYSGVLPPARSQSLSADRGSFSLSIPAASAALVTFGR